MKLLVALAAIGISVTVTGEARAGSPMPDGGRLDEILVSSAQDLHLAAIAAAVVKDGDIVWRGTTGMADLENQVPVTSETRFMWASVTKSITAQAVLRLIAAGKLTLETPIDSVIPAYVGPGHAATIAQFLTHTAGMPGKIPDLKEQDVSEGEMLSCINEMFALYPPGSGFTYANNDYYVLGLVVERITGQTYIDAVRDLVLTPMGVPDVQIMDQRLIAHRARGYVGGGPGGLINARYEDVSLVGAGGALGGTAEELALFGARLFDPERVPAAVRKMMIEAVTLPGAISSIYLKGALIRGMFEGQDRYSHGGSWSGFRSWFVTFPSDNLTVAVLTNGEGDPPVISAAYDVMERLAREALGHPQFKPRNLPIAARDLAAWSGVYDFTPIYYPFPKVAILTADGQLKMQLGPGRVTPLLYQGNGEFVAAFDKELALRFRPGPEELPELELRLAGTEMIGRR